jgi:heterotetrameric sarcosine oxidase gamma subunit
MTQSYRDPLPSPLQQAGVTAEFADRPSLALSEVPDMTVLRLHSLEDAASLASGLQEVGMELPADTNAASGDDPAALCLRPGEWLLLSQSATPAELFERLRPRIDSALTALLDVSDGLGIFRLSGAAAPWVLAKLSGLDFVAGVSGGQHAARTRMADIAVVVHFNPAPGGAPRFDLVFDRSVARYFWDLLNDAAPHAEELLIEHGVAHGAAA